MNNLKKNIENPNATEACKHINTDCHFNKHAKLILIEHLRNIKKISAEALIIRKGKLLHQEVEGISTIYF